MVPVEKMAARLLSRHKLQPPYDLTDLVENYATVESHDFPFKADGITIGIGGEGKPQILINSNTPKTRQRFTLAHELGHIIIPWHTGTIVSHLDKVEADADYREMEAEANRFAAELLIPTDWLRAQENKELTIEDFLSLTLDDTQVSRDAAFIKVFNTLKVSVICAQLDSDGNIVDHYRSSSSPAGASLIGRNVNEEVIFHTSNVEESFELGDRSYRSWLFLDNHILEDDPRPWREVLSQILEEVDGKELLPSVNAILPSKYHSNKEKNETELYSLILQTYDGRAKLNKVVAHSLFPQYVIKRIKELVAKNRT